MVMLFKILRVTALQHLKFSRKTPTRHIADAPEFLQYSTVLRDFNSQKCWTTSPPQPKCFDNIKKVTCFKNIQLTF